MNAVPQPSEQRQFLEAVFGQETGYLFVSTNDRSLKATDSNARAWRDRGFVYPLQLADILAYIENQDKRGLDVYVAAQLYKSGAARQKQAVKVCPSAWSDLDTASPFGVQPEPSVILETSPGRYHGFWRAERPLEPYAAEQLSRRIAYAYHRDGADLGGWDLTQVLRVPGTTNKKYPGQPVVRLLKCDPSPLAEAAFNRLPAAPVRPNTVSPADDGDPPVPLKPGDLAHWQMTETEDRSGWAMKMVSTLKEYGLADRLVEVVLANHPIYLAKAREKWGNRESLIHDDIRRCLQRWREQPRERLALPTVRLDGAMTAPRDAATAADAYPTQTLSELLFNDDEQEDGYLVDGFLRRGRCHWVYSAPGVGKTLLVLVWGIHVAAGQVFCGRQAEAGTVLFFGEDSPLASIREYAELLADAHDVNVEGLPFYLNRERGFRLTSDASLEIAKSVTLRHNPALVIMDSCERIVPSEKYSSSELDYLTRFIAWLTDQGITVIVVDHTNKKLANMKPEDAEKADMLDLLFGGRSKSAIADVAMYLSGAFRSGGQVVLKWTKQRGEAPDNVSFRFDRAEGFTLTESPKKPRTETERRILAWFNNGNTNNEVDGKAIIEGAAIKPRTAERTLREMVRYGLLYTRSVGTERGGAQHLYRLNTEYAGPFRV